MRLLELFSGTKSIGRAFEALGWDVTSVDMDARSNPTILADVLQWDYRSHAPPGYYHFVWASPPCTQYSVARTTAKTPRDFAVSDEIVTRTLEIVDYFAPSAGWLLENPLTGYLKTRPVVRGLPFRDVCYCMYGYPYRKSTRLWGSLDGFAPRPMCLKALRCPGFDGLRHPTTAQRGPRRGESHGRYTLNQLYSIPRELCDEIARAATAAVLRGL